MTVTLITFYMSSLVPTQWRWQWLLFTCHPTCTDTVTVTLITFYLSSDLYRHSDDDLDYFLPVIRLVPTQWRWPWFLFTCHPTSTDTVTVTLITFYLSSDLYRHSDGDLDHFLPVIRLAHLRWRDAGRDDATEWAGHAESPGGTAIHLR